MACGHKLWVSFERPNEPPYSLRFCQETSPEEHAVTVMGAVLHRIAVLSLSERSKRLDQIGQISRDEADLHLTGGLTPLASRAVFLHEWSPSVGAPRKKPFVV